MNRLREREPRLEQGDRGDGRTSRDSVADASVHLLAAQGLSRITFEILDDPTADDWTKSLRMLQPDAKDPDV